MILAVAYIKNRHIRFWGKLGKIPLAAFYCQYGVIKQWGNRIGHIHLKDAVGIPEMGKFVFPLLGEGKVNWLDFFTALNEIGYMGYCCVEFESFSYYEQILDNDPEAAARISMEQIGKLIRGKLSSD